MAADRRNSSAFRTDPQRGDDMNPYGTTRRAVAWYWTVGALFIVLAVALWFVFG